MNKKPKKFMKKNYALSDSKSYLKPLKNPVNY